MWEYKIILGYSASIVALLGYVPYIRDVFRGKTKPHAFSWLIWALITGTVFVIQVLEGGGAGAWVSGVSALVTLCVAILGFSSKGERTFVAFDWVALACSLFGIVLWQVTEEPLYAIIILSITDAIAYLPTLRKSFYKPFEETLTVYAVGVLKLVLAFFAFEVVILTVWLYPATLIVMNVSLIAVCLIRRKMIPENNR